MKAFTILLAAIAVLFFTVAAAVATGVTMAASAMFFLSAGCASAALAWFLTLLP